MRWSAIDPRDGWRAWFAILPVKIGDQVIWLERYERRFMGDCYETRALTARSGEGDTAPTPASRGAGEGWKLMPPSPTPAMIEAFWPNAYDVVRCWQAMFNAAPGEPMSLAGERGIGNWHPGDDT